MSGHRATSSARRASDHPALEGAARAGYAVSGVLHLLIGWIALQVALVGGGGRSADQSGALGSLASNGLGRALLWLGAVGFAGLALWQLVDAAVGHPGDDRDAWFGRLKSAGKAAVHLLLAWSAIGFARGGSSDSGSQTADLTASLMRQPGGRVMVAVVGVAVIGIGAYHVHKGWTRRFLRDLEDHPGTWATRLGQGGYVAKGAALAIAGSLFVTAALHERAAEATGLDGALKSLLDQPFGTALLVAMAVGFAAFGLYSFSRAKHAKV